MRLCMTQIAADIPEPGGAAGIGRAAAASLGTSRAPAPVRVGARPLWTPDMARPLTERSTNAAKLDVPLPQGFPDAFQRLVDERNRATGDARKRIYARDLFEEAIGELIQRVENEHVTFIATPFRNFVRKKFWVDGTLKGGVEQLALTHGITRSAVVMTAFHHYLGRHGALQDAAAPVSSLGS